MRQAFIFIGGVLFITASVMAFLSVLHNANTPTDIETSFFEPSADAFSNITGQQDILEENQISSMATTSIDTILSSWRTRPGAGTIFNTQAIPATSTPSTEVQSPYSDFKSFVETFLGTSITQNTTSETGTDEGIWLGGYTSSVQPVVETSESNIQKSIRLYTNAIATTISDFNLAQGNQTDTLKVFVNNRADTSGLEQLSNNYVALSEKIDAIEVPPQANTVQSGLVSAYKAVGEQLWDLSLAQNDEDFLNKILTYNKSSEEVAKYHVALATLVKAYGVTFQPNEPGKVFLFSGGLQ